MDNKFLKTVILETVLTKWICRSLTRTDICIKSSQVISILVLSRLYRINNCFSRNKSPSQTIIIYRKTFFEQKKTFWSDFWWNVGGAIIEIYKEEVIILQSFTFPELESLLSTTIIHFIQCTHNERKDELSLNYLYSTIRGKGYHCVSRIYNPSCLN